MRHIQNPTDADIQVGLFLEEHGACVKIDRNERAAWFTRNVDKWLEDYKDENATRFSFEDVLKQFPNGIFYAETGDDV